MKQASLRVVSTVGRIWPKSRQFVASGIEGEWVSGKRWGWRGKQGPDCIRYCKAQLNVILKAKELLEFKKECDTFRFVFLKSHSGYNVENELDRSNILGGHCSDRYEWLQLASFKIMLNIFDLESSFVHSAWGKRNLSAGGDDPSILFLSPTHIYAR